MMAVDIETVHRINLETLLPVPISVVEMAFPAHALRDLMPPMDSIPEPFRNESGEAAKWCELQSRWFYKGIDGIEMIPAEGIDPAMAFRHLKAIQGSFAPKHEHKKAAVAYLLSRWFTSFSFPNDPKPETP